MSFNNNTTQNTGFVSRFQAVLKKLFTRNNHPGHLPFIPQVGQTLPNPTAGISSEFTESKAAVQNLYGTGIMFGTTEVIAVDKDGNGREIVQGQSYLLGNGRIVTKAEQVAGICPICKNDILPQMEAGLISLQDAHLMSMYDVQSAAICDLCGRNTCSMHCRPIKIEGDTIRACSICLLELKKAERRKNIICWFLAPLMETTPNNPEDRR
jgi:hypothetical protein